MSLLLRGNRSRCFRTTRRLNSLRYRPSLAPTFCRQHSHNAEHTVQRPPEFMFRIRGVLRKQGNYVVLVIKFGRGLQEDEEKYFQARSSSVANVERRSEQALPIAREGFSIVPKTFRRTLIRSSNSACVSQQRRAVPRSNPSTERAFCSPESWFCTLPQATYGDRRKRPLCSPGPRVANIP
jgi:hypothetical protein